MKNKLAYSLSVLFLTLVSGISISMAVETKTPAPAVFAGKYCVSGGEKGLKILEAIPAKDKSLDFGVSIWFESGQQCGVVGNAKIVDGGWRYESSDKSENCILSFKQSSAGDITVNADQTANCASACGGGVSISDITFPVTSREKMVVTKKELEPETLFNNTECVAAPK